MILEKIYSFDKLPYEYNTFLITLSEYQKTITRKIITECARFQYSKGEKPVIFVGYEAFYSICDSSSFGSSTIDHSYNPEYVGHLLTYDLYYDNRLEPCKVILGSSSHEINNFITTKGRKQKLEKLNLAISKK